MADAITISRTTLFRAKPSCFSSYPLRPCTSPLRPRCAVNIPSPKSNLGPHGKVRKAPALPSLDNNFAKWMVSQRLVRGCGGRPAAPLLVYASSRAANVVDGGSNLPVPPSSKEETVQQAASSLFAVLEKTLKQQGPTMVKEKRRNIQRQVRLRVDIPLLEDSPQALFTLTQNLVDSFLGGRNIAGKAAVCFSNSAVLDPAGRALSVSNSSIATYQRLESTDGLPKDAAFALVIAPTFLQAPSLDLVVKSAGLRPVIILNPEWSEDEEQDKIWGALLNSFSVAYSFIPLNIQGFFSKTEGAVLKCVRKGAPEGQPWLIHVKDGDNYKCVSRLKKRPTPHDLENALYSSMAANSPVNKSIVFLRGLISK